MTWTWHDDDPATALSAENMQTHVELRLRALEVAGGGGGGGNAGAYLIGSSDFNGNERSPGGQSVLDWTNATVSDSGGDGIAFVGADLALDGGTFIVFYSAPISQWSDASDVHLSVYSEDFNVTFEDRHFDPAAPHAQAEGSFGVVQAAPATVPFYVGVQGGSTTDLFVVALTVIRIS